MSASRPLLVLVGGGHAHVQVLSLLPAALVNSYRCLLLSDTRNSVYSGLLPSVISHISSPSSLSFPLAPLCARHNFTFLHARVTSISQASRTLTYHSPPTSSEPQTLSFDLLSINLGSRTPSIPKTSTHPPIISTRPINLLLPRIQLIEAVLPPKPIILVLGAGAAGIELALNLYHRLCLRDPAVKVKIISSGSLKTSFGAATAAAVDAELDERGIERVTAVVKSLDENGVVLTNGQKLNADCVVLATGSAPHGWVKKNTDLPTENGWIVVDETLRVKGSDGIYAGGDCVTFAGKYGENFPPRAGVYAVRMGPVLAENLKREMMGGGGSRVFVPQASFLALLCLGDGRGIGSKYGIVFRGAWVMRLKTYIDEGWMKRFRVEGTEEEVVEEVAWEGGAEEAVAMLELGEEIEVGDGFEKQLQVLKRMDKDEEFRKQVLTVVQRRREEVAGN